MVAALCIITPSTAHETWILPATSHIEKPGDATLLVTSGMSFPRPEVAVDPTSVSRSGVCVGNPPCRELEPHSVIGSALAVRAKIDQPGIATVWLELPPHAIELTPALVEEYFNEIRVDQALRDAWAAEQPKVWRERYAKFAKTILRVGAPESADVAWSKPIGGALEIVPNSDPTQLRTGDSLTVRVLKHSVPLAGLMLAVQENGLRDWQQTDAHGQATFTLRGRGPWLIHGTALQRAGPNDEGIEWESWFTTLTIAPPRQPLTR